MSPRLSFTGQRLYHRFDWSLLSVRELDTELSYVVPFSDFTEAIERVLSLPRLHAVREGENGERGGNNGEVNGDPGASSELQEKFRFLTKFRKSVESGREVAVDHDKLLLFGKKNPPASSLLQDDLNRAFENGPEGHEVVPFSPVENEEELEALLSSGEFGFSSQHSHLLDPRS